DGCCPKRRCQWTLKGPAIPLAARERGSQARTFMRTGSSNRPRVKLRGGSRRCQRVRLPRGAHHDCATGG
ncbi:unnamed protein product, partial [Polarella glacialis]